MFTLFSALVSKNQPRELGAVAVEYMLLISLVVIILIAAIGLFGTSLNSELELLVEKIADL